MIESKTRCPACKSKIDCHYHTYWMCGSCGVKYPCVQGIPKLYLEEHIGKADKDRRDRLYDSLPGKIWGFLQPFLLLPVRPIRISVMLWFIYFLFFILFIFFVYQCVEWIVLRQFHDIVIIDVFWAFVFASYVLFLIKFPFLGYLLLLAIPVKVITSLRRFKPDVNHLSVHAQFQEEYLKSEDRLRLLDVATGSCSSLFRHGWMSLNAEYTAVDLSERMITQGMRFMSARGVPVDFIMCDALKLPFESETFDVVTSYGAINGFGDPKGALYEMVRVTKKNGKILFLDEQLYELASWVEKLYYKKVLTYGNTIEGCPMDILPAELEDVEVHQVYEFVYICTARKRPI